VVAVIAAGEQWANAGVREAEEDLLGAGAVLGAAGGAPSPEARAACGRFGAWDGDLASTPSGQELLGWGFGDDVAMAAEIDVSTTVPVLRDHAFVPVE
jgi:2-phosphosulfolactate phosphatase